MRWDLSCRGYIGQYDVICANRRGGKWCGFVVLTGKDVSVPEVDFVRIALSAKASLYEETGFACSLKQDGGGDTNHVRQEFTEILIGHIWVDSFCD